MDRGKFIKYFKRNLTLMPTAFTAYDSSHISLVYFCLFGLKVLDALDEVVRDDDERKKWIEWIYLHLVGSGEGFRGSLSHKLQSGGRGDINDPANLSATFFCLSMLAMLKDEKMSSRLNRRRILKYVKECQRSSGQFGAISHSSVGPMGDNDPRYTYVAAGIRRILKGQEVVDSDFDVDKAVEFIKSVQSYDGGLGDRRGCESHAGLTFCGIAALGLMNRLDVNGWKDTAVWLSKRQVSKFTIEQCDDVWYDWEEGGFNGRINKPADTCYAYWTSASLKNLDSISFVDSSAAKSFLLENCLDKVLGGMVKVKGGYADPLHSYLGLAALAVLSPELGFEEFDCLLTLPRSVVAFIDDIEWE